ncbi:unnamed protein product [Schistosoma curassoni]|uniref:Reverse transcriptase domain-containing protein n=1 Tax=Schistosoma curassoni TaxID=6186 RepID=A0A183KDG9_9TREM|nr:unnamed protein product [Schistosoma curassoni]
MKDAVDAQLRDQQAGFRKDRSCTDQIATLRTIVEQSIEWNSSLYINFIDYEKAFDSVDRRTLWKLFRHCGVPEKIVNIIRNSYDGLQCKVVHGGQLTDAFQVRTGVRQDCLLSPFLFLLVFDWIMKTSTSEGKHGIQWTAQNQLDDLDFADDLALLSHTHELMQIKTASVAAVSASVGLSIHKEKTKVLKFKAENSNPITLDGETLEDVESFTYLGSIIDKQGGSDADVKTRICKARVAFLQLKNIWDSKQLSVNQYQIPLNDGVSLPTTVSLKLPDSSSSNSSSSNNTSTSSCSNHILKYNRELTDELDLNNQNIERFGLMHNLNNENNNNMNEHHHHSAYNTYIKRRNSENYEHSKLLYNNNTNAIPSTTGNQLFNVSETIGNHCHITISKRRDNATITNLQSINNNSNCTKITSTTPFSSSFRDPNTMNQLLTRLNSIPTTHYSRPEQSRNIIRTHSCSRGKSRYYSHGSASVPDPASPVRSWSSISSGTEHSLTNRIVCKSRKQLNDQTDSGFIETSYLMKTLNTNKPLPQNSSSTYLGKKSDHFHNSYDDNRTTNLSQYNEDIKSKKSNEIDSRTYTRRKHSRSNDQNGKSIGF